MRLNNLKIRNFRNLTNINFEFSDNANYFYAPNGTGKTNVLETIQCISIGKSQKAKSPQDLIQINTKKSLQVSGCFQDQDEISFQNTYKLIFEDQKFKKQLFHNGNKIQIKDFIGKAPTIWFGPEYIKIIDSSPEKKRHYFDDIMIQLDSEYYYNLRSYNRVLLQRNRLLKSEFLAKEQMKIWTEQLIKFGARILQSRNKFFSELNDTLSKNNYQSRYKFKLVYSPDILTNMIFNEDLDFAYRKALQEAYKIDLQHHTTTRGIHRDNWYLEININKKGFVRADKFASRGQQRVGLIALETTIINLFYKKNNEYPILLLDDIFSELDEENRDFILDYININKIQSFVTGVNKIKGKNSLNQIDLKGYKF